MNSKRWMTVLLTACMVVSAMAQQMEVKDFTRQKRYLWNRSKVVIDKQKAIIDLKTTEQGFSFIANGKDAAESKETDGMITVKVPDKTRYLTVKHPQYGQLTRRVPAKYLKRKKHYRATLVATDPTKEYKPRQQWVVMDITPQEAIVTMDSTVTLLSDGQYAAAIDLGEHQYKVEAPFFEEQTGSFLLTDTAKVNLSIRLQPTYAFATVLTPWETGEIYIDGLYVAHGQGTSRRLQEGNHRLTVFLAKTCVYDQVFSIGQAEKRVITIRKSDVHVVPVKKTAPALTGISSEELAEKQTAAVEAPVTLKTADADTEIWIDRQQVGKGQWNGKLAQGYHIVQTVRDGITSETSDMWITDSSPVELDLAVPTTSMATLNIHSNVTGADIYVNGACLGQTPSILTHLPAGKTYTIRLRKNGYKEGKITIVPQGNEITEVKIKMKQQ